MTKVNEAPVAPNFDCKPLTQMISITNVRPPGAGEVGRAMTSPNLVLCRLLRQAAGCAVRVDRSTGSCAAIELSERLTGARVEALADRRRHGDGHRHLVNALYRNSGLRLAGSSGIQLAYSFAVSPGGVHFF